MRPISDCLGNLVGWKSGDVLRNRSGMPCAFVRGTEVFTFCQRHIGECERSVFRNSEGRVVGCVGAPASRSTSPTQRRKRCQVTRWLSFSVPAPRPAMSFRVWAIWDHALDSIAAR